MIYVLAIVSGLALMRFAWVWASLRLTILRKGADQVHLSGKLPRRLIAAMSVAGVRGAITLAGVLTLPLVLNDGTPFPARDLAIFLATGVILVSLLIATLALPVLLNGLQLPEPSHQAEENAARMATADAAIRAIEQRQHELAERHNHPERYVDAGNRIMDRYRERIDGLEERGSEETRVQDVLLRELGLVGVSAERAELTGLIRAGRVGSEVAQKLTRELDFAEARLS